MPGAQTACPAMESAGRTDGNAPIQSCMAHQCKGTGNEETYRRMSGIG